MIDVVIISPHLDDAVLSIGGLIAREVAVGRKVEIVTCFTAGPPLDTIPPERRVFGDYSMRLAEDERALNVLGATHRWLGLHERIWREPPLPRSRSIFPTSVFQTPPKMEDFSELKAIRAAIAQLDAPVIYAPLGIGHHVDHVEVALAALREVLGSGAFERIRFYEDVYALGHMSRRQHFVARRHMWKTFGAPAWASPRTGALLTMIGLVSKGPRIEHYLPEADRLDWRCTPEVVSVADEERKLAAIAEYGSQVRAFGGMDRVRAFMKRAHRTLGGEPIWTCRTGAPK